MSTDGGGSWTSVPLPTTVLGGATASTGNAVVVTGSDTACQAPATWVTSDNARNWYLTNEPTLWWAGPGGGESTATRACDEEPLDLAALDSRTAHAVCPDGRVKSTDDGGQNWSDVVQLAGARGVDTRNRGDGVEIFVASLGESCDGVLVTELDPAGATQATGCAPMTSSDARFDVAVSGATTWVASADGQLAVSRDELQTWGQP